MRGRHEAWQDHIDEHKPNPTNESLEATAEPAIRKHTTHAQNDLDDLMEHTYRFAMNKTLTEDEPKRRSNDNGER